MTEPAAAAPRDRTVVRPTPFGILLALLLAASTVWRPAVIDPSVIGLVWAGLAGALLLGSLWPVITVRTVGVRIVRAPTDLVVDQLSSLEVELTGRASGLSLGCTGLPMKLVDVVSPGAVRIPIAVAQRGAYRRVRLDLGSDAPFGVVSAVRTRLVDLPRELLVGPTSEPTHVRAGPYRDELSVPHPAGASRRGESVRSVRDYTTGDPSHLVHWPSTARTGTLVVRELEPPAAEALAVVVDLRPGSGDGASVADAARGGARGAPEAVDERVEAAARRAAGVCESALAHGARVLLCTTEPAGPVTGEVADMLAVRRRLALAVEGPPPEPPADWPVEHIRVSPPATRHTSPEPTDPTDEQPRRRRRRPRVSPDRRTISHQRVWLLTALAGVQIWAALSSLPVDAGGVPVAEIAALCAVLAIFGLRSMPIRWVVRDLTLLTAVILGGFGELGTLGGLTGSWRVLVWLAATAAVLTLAPSSRTVPGEGTGIVINALDLPQAPPSGAPRRTAGRAAGRGRRKSTRDQTDERDRTDEKETTRGRVSVPVLVAAVTLAGASALLVGPRVGTLFPVATRGSDLVDLSDRRSDNALVATDSLDMTTRPRLTDRVVMSVRSPITSFWRTGVYDTWNGDTWTRSEPRDAPVGNGGVIVPEEHDLAATAGVPTTQVFRLEAGYATALPAAPSPVRIDATSPVVQSTQGTLYSRDDPLGDGTTYTVESRQVHLDEDQLRAAQAQAPPELLARYAAAPVITDQVAELAARVTAGATNNYDRIRALEGWMNENTEYSLDAPLSPPGVDVVDHFLFTERVGWCEQIASSLVVMARSVGIPARLATGFAPGEWDAVGDRFVVRELDAHAWAEVWFPDAGWVAFDPTATVPFAGSAEATAGAAAFDWREIVGTALALIGLVAAFAHWLRSRLGRWSSTVRARVRRRRLLAQRWDVAEEARIERLGAQMGRARFPDETITTYSVEVARLAGDAELAHLGARIDRFRYGPP